MQIERRPYSRNPWRLVTSAGAEVELPERFAHPELGAVVIRGSIRGRTHAEREARALALLERQEARQED